MVEIFEAIRNLAHRLTTVENRERVETAGAIQPLAFANLPAAGQRGRLRFCTNGRKVGEGAGVGTGIVAYDDGVAWRRTADDTTVAI